MAVLKPAAFHGQGKKGPFFEGWYFKHVSKNGDQRWTIIPGMYIGRKPEDSHSFIQFLNGVNGQSWYIEFPYSEFSSERDKFHTRIGSNEFSSSGMKLQIERDDFSVSGEFNYEDTKPWPVTILSPGIMGWFAWVPGMECYHGVVSLDHAIKGGLTINRQKIDFSGGRGYMEKDWGKAMPNAWIWSQTNHFSKTGTSLTLSVADIPFGPLSFNGFITGLLLDGQLHRFATYTGARIESFSIEEEKVDLVFTDMKERLEVSASRGRTSALQAPTLTQMDRRIQETLSAEVKVNLSVRRGAVWQTVFEDTGKYAGLEIVGDLDPGKF